MITDKKTAKEISQIMLDISGLLDESVASMQNSTCPQEEKLMYNKFAGQLMGEICFDFLNKLYRVHPDIKPDEYMLPENFLKDDNP